MEKRFSNAWNHAIKVFFRNYLLLFVTTLVSGLISFVLACTGIGILAIPAILAGASTIYLKTLRKQPVSFGVDLFACFPKWWTLFAVTFVKWLCIAVGLAVLVVPGIYLITRWSFVFPLVFDKGFGFKEAFSKSHEMTQGRFWEVFAMWILNAFINAILASFQLGSILVGSYPCLVQLEYYNSFNVGDTQNIEIEVC